MVFCGVGVVVAVFLTLFECCAPPPPTSTPVPSKTVLRAPPFLWNVVSTHHVEPTFQRRGTASIAFPLPTNCPPHGEGTVDGSGSERVHSDLPSVVLSHLFCLLFAFVQHNQAPCSLFLDPNGNG